LPPTPHNTGPDDGVPDNETQRASQGAWQAYATDAFRRHASDLVVENRGNEDTQNYDAELARRTVEQAGVVARTTNCRIRQEAGARAVEDDEERGLKKGDDISQRKIAPRDRKGEPIKRQNFDHSFPDMAFYATKTERRLYINSYTPRNKAGDPSAWELFSSARLQRNAETGDIVLLVPKLGPREVLDAVKFRAIVGPLLFEICQFYKPAPGAERVPRYIEKNVKRPRD
jgi:hypothetical protein